MSHDPEEGVRVSAPAATLFGLSALLLSISMGHAHITLNPIFWKERGKTQHIVKTG